MQADSELIYAAPEYLTRMEEEKGRTAKNPGKDLGKGSGPP